MKFEFKEESNNYAEVGDVLILENGDKLLTIEKKGERFRFPTVNLITGEITNSYSNLCYLAIGEKAYANDYEQSKIVKIIKARNLKLVEV